MGADELGNFWEEYCVVYCSLFYFSVEKGEFIGIIGENGSGNAEKLSGIGSINGFVRSMGCEQTAN